MDEARKQQFQGQWDQIKGKVKEQYGQVTDNDLKQTEGRFDQVVGVIRERTGKKASEIEQDLDRISSETVGSRTRRD